MRIAAALAGLALPAAALAGAPAPRPASGLWLGADLSYVNEMEDCGAVYRAGGKPVDPFALLAQKGGNIVRVRIWNDAKWTKYSDLADVTKTIHRAKASGMQVLLDFHYSDDWADGEKQIAPAAWAKLDTGGQAKALHDYTLEVLRALNSQGLMPEMVQVGNETNPELMGGVKERPINWRRNALLLNAGLKAVREAGQAATIAPRIMLHIAQPENAEPWFAAAQAAGLTDYDVIGLSYYKKWSTRSMVELGEAITRLKTAYGKDVVVVETAYPFTNDNADKAPNLLGPDTLVEGYPATPAGQRQYLVDLTQTVVDGGGVGLVYWEPNWVSTACRTRWSQGSNWENAAWFDYHGEALPAFDFLSRRYARRP